MTIWPALASRETAFVHPALLLTADDDCVIDVAIDAIRLGSGQWYVNIAIGEVGALDSSTAKYFTLDARWHHHLAARIELRVASGEKTSSERLGHKEFVPWRIGPVL